jgi:hypothetical protein
VREIIVERAKIEKYTVAGKAIGFAPEQPLHVVGFACPALKQLEYKH